MPFLICYNLSYTRSCASQDSLSVARHLLHQNSFSLFARSALTVSYTEPNTVLSVIPLS